MNSCFYFVPLESLLKLMVINYYLYRSSILRRIISLLLKIHLIPTNFAIQKIEEEEEEGVAGKSYLIMFIKPGEEVDDGSGGDGGDGGSGGGGAFLTALALAFRRSGRSSSQKMIFSRQRSIVVTDNHDFSGQK